MVLPRPFAPSWFTPVMGTGIVAIAVEAVPLSVPGRHELSLALWLLAAALLVAVAAAGACAWRRDPGLARRQLDDTVLGHSYGAPAMASLTVGAGAVLTGHQVLGAGLAVALDTVLWSAGTALGVLTAVLVPVRAIGVHVYGDRDASGAWLMPVVPPMVSAATGGLLVPHLPPGQPQQTLLLACYALAGATLLIGLLVLGQLWQRLVRHGPDGAALAPALWIPLGFLGQSVTAVHHLGALAPGVLPAYGRPLHALTVVYGVPVWGFALLWLAIAVCLTRRAMAEGMPFGLGWWAFVFPLGTVVTGTEALADATGLAAFDVLASALLLALTAVWALVAARTLSAVVQVSRAALLPAG